jgi:hypothetical protein
LMNHFQFSSAVNKPKTHILLNHKISSADQAY